MKTLLIVSKTKMKILILLLVLTFTLNMSLCCQTQKKFHTEIERLYRHQDSLAEEIKILYISNRLFPLNGRIIKSDGSLVELTYLDTNKVKICNSFMQTPPKTKQGIYIVLPNFEKNLRLEFIDVSTNDTVHKELIRFDPKIREKRWRSHQDILEGFQINFGEFPRGIYFVLWLDDDTNELLMVDKVRNDCISINTSED